MKTFLKTIAVLAVSGFAFVFASGQLVSGATLITWVYSQETVKYDTPDGDLHVGEYALQPDGKSYIAYVATSSQQSATSTYAISAHLTSSSDVNAFTGMTLVHDIGRKYYNAFTDGAIVLKSPSTQAGYKNLDKKNANTPTYTASGSTLAFLKGFVSPQTAFAAIAYDNAQSYTACVTGTSCTYSYTVTGANTFLVCMNLNYTTSPGTTTMSYAGQSMTRIGSQQVDSSAGNNTTMDTFYLKGAASGANNLVITTTNSMTNGFYAHCASYSGVDQTAPVESNIQHIVNYNTCSSDNASIATVNDNAWVVGIWGDDAGRVHTAGAGTMRTTDGQGDIIDIGPTSPPATTTVQSVNNAGAGCIATAVAIKPWVTTITGTALQVESQMNPLSIATSNPRFSAIYSEASTTALATSYQIQVSKTAGVWTSPYWDSGKKTLSSSTPVGQRSPQIYSTTTFPLDRTVYYWRIMFWNQMGTAGAWSTSTDSFTMAYPGLLQDLTYVYDKAGNITQITDNSGTNSAGVTTYSYDNLYRLTRASTTNTVQSPYLQIYSYDALGNLTNKSDQGNYTYAQTGYANPDAATMVGINQYTYDNAGNLTSGGNGSATTTYTWDYRGRMSDSASTQGGATTTSYKYDVNDQRVQMDVKKGASATTSTKYYNQFYQVSGATTTIYLYAGGQLLATIEGKGSGTTTNLTHTDHLNSTAVTSGPTGVQTQLLAYMPYGDSRINQQASGNFGSQKRFLSQYGDDQTNFAYLQNRYLKNTEGRFVTIDPVSRDVAMMQKQSWYMLSVTGNPASIDQNALLGDPQMLNLYSYARSNPVSLSDPSGLIVQLVSRPVEVPGAKKVGAHTFLQVTPENAKTIGNIPGIDTSQTFTLGATPINGALVKDPNGDINYVSKCDGCASTVVAPPRGVTQEQFEQNLVSNFNSLPQTLSGTYGTFGMWISSPNSNNAATTYLNGAGVSPLRVDAYQVKLFLQNKKLTPGLGVPLGPWFLRESITSVIQSIKK